MKKKIILTGIFLVLVFFINVFGTGSLVKASTEGAFTYTITGTAPNQTAILTGYTGAGGSLILPNTLGNGAYPITSIGAGAFWGCYKITYLILPNTLTSIEAEAFQNCSGLPRIVIPNNVTSIGNLAFAGDSGLTEVRLGSGLVNIGENAFQACTRLVEITLPKSVSSIGKTAFSRCTSLTSIKVEAYNLNYSSQNGVLFDKTKKTLIECGAGKEGSFIVPDSTTLIKESAFADCTKITSLTLGSGVKQIEGFAFFNCSSLTGVEIPKNVISLGDSAFYGCINLKSVTLGEGLTSIGNQLFCYCPALSSVTFSKNLTSIGNLAFEGCSSLAAVMLPQGVVDIGENAFADCKALTSITLPDKVKNIKNRTFSNCRALLQVNLGAGITKIGLYAFDGCSTLTKLIIPDNVREIGEAAFGYCSALAEVTIGSGANNINASAFCNCEKLVSIVVDSKNLAYSSQDGILFDKTKTLLVECGAGKSGSYLVPATVSKIGALAFYDCKALMGIIFGDNVISIDNSAFLYCTSLNNLVIPDGVQSIGDYAFAHCEALTKIKLGKGLIKLGANAFWGCTALTEAYFFGNAPIGNANSFFTCAPGFKIFYDSKTTGWTNYWQGYSAEPFDEQGGEEKPQKIIILTLGNLEYTVNGEQNFLDSAPIIKNGRTLLPISPVINALGGTTSWEVGSKKVTVMLGTNKIELWIGKNLALVNGGEVKIDKAEAQVVPEIINSRTMLPIRFISENLGGTVVWDGTKKTITIIY